MADMDKYADRGDAREYRRLRALARPYYPAEGPNSWAHIQEVRRRAAKMMRRLEGRPLTPAEYAAVMFHDNTKQEFGGRDHGRMGADRAALILAAAGYGKPMVDEATGAIRVHDDNLSEFPSRTAELLASADANPPDLDWVLNKSYNWAIGKGMKGGDRVRHVVETVPAKYGEGGTFNVPGIYRKYYGDRLDGFRRQLSELDEGTAAARLKAYRDSYGIGEDETRVIHNV